MTEPSGMPASRVGPTVRTVQRVFCAVVGAIFIAMGIDGLGFNGAAAWFPVFVSALGALIVVAALLTSWRPPRPSADAGDGAGEVSDDSAFTDGAVERPADSRIDPHEVVGALAWFGGVAALLILVALVGMAAGALAWLSGWFVWARVRPRIAIPLVVGMGLLLVVVNVVLQMDLPDGLLLDGAFWYV